MTVMAVTARLVNAVHLLPACCPPSMWSGGIKHQSRQLAYSRCPRSRGNDLFPLRYAGLLLSCFGTACHGWVISIRPGLGRHERVIVMAHPGAPSCEIAPSCLPRGTGRI